MAGGWSCIVVSLISLYCKNAYLAPWPNTVGPNLFWPCTIVNVVFHASTYFCNQPSQREDRLHKRASNEHQRWSQWRKIYIGVKQIEVCTKEEPVQWWRPRALPSANPMTPNYIAAWSRGKEIEGTTNIDVDPWCLTAGTADELQQCGMNMKSPLHRTSRRRVHHAWAPATLDMVLATIGVASALSDRWRCALVATSGGGRREGGDIRGEEVHTTTTLPHPSLASKLCTSHPMHRWWWNLHYLAHPPHLTTAGIAKSGHGWIHTCVHCLASTLLCNPSYCWGEGGKCKMCASVERHISSAVIHGQTRFGPTVIHQTKIMNLIMYFTRCGT